MPILDADVVWKKSALVSDTLPAQNGGRMTALAITSGVKNNIFPDATSSERTAGSIKWRKAFIHIASASDTALANVRVFLDAITPGADYATIHAGTQTDTQNQVTARPYGIGILASPVIAGDNGVLIDVENYSEFVTLTPFRVGDLVRIADRPSVGGAGSEEWKTIASVVNTGTQISIGFGTDLFANNFASGVTLVSSAIVPANVIASFANWTETSAAGTYAEGTAGNVVAHNRGAIEQVWTITFTSATAFSVSGDTVGNVGSGTISSDFSPTNTGAGGAYFTIKAAGWGGTWAAADTVSFATHPAAIPIWYCRRIPAGAASFANNFVSVAIQGEAQ